MKGTIKLVWSVTQCYTGALQDTLNTLADQEAHVHSMSRSTFTPEWWTVVAYQAVLLDAPAQPSSEEEPGYGL